MIAVVTGSNRGLGLELCRQCKDRGLTVIAACRQTSPALEALGVVCVPGIDVADPASYGPLVAACEGKTISILVNNAGTLSQEDVEAMAHESGFEAVRKQLEVNAIGPLAVTAALRSNLAHGSKVVVITSRMGSIADNSSGGFYGYRMSKAALNAGSVSLAHDLKGAGIAVGIIHPGLVETDMAVAAFGVKAGVGSTIDTATSVEGIMGRIDRLTLENTGSFWHGVTGEILPW